MTTTADTIIVGDVGDSSHSRPSPRRAFGGRLRLVAPVLGVALVATLGPLASPAAAAHTALERVTASSPHDINDGKSVVARCPSTKRLVGTGAEITGGAGQVVIDDITPNATLTQVTATGYEDHDGNKTATGVDIAWHITAYAICATPFPGLVLAKASNPPLASPMDSTSPKTVTASCPTNTRLVGTGADMTGAVGDAGIVAITPFASGVTASAVEGHSGTAALWRLNAYAICASPPLGLQIVAGPVSVFDSVSPKTMSVSCPVGKFATGAGARISNGAGHVVLDDLRPTPNPAASVTSTGIEEDHGYAANWSIVSFAICVTA